MTVFEIPLKVVPGERKTISACFDGDVCLIKIPFSLRHQTQRSTGLIDRVYWQLLGHLYQPMIKERTEELNRFFYGFSYRSVRFHRQFRRWGSCSSLGNINLSHRLMGAPQHLVDYVILHELAHLKYLNHSREFWNLLKQAYDHRSAQKSLIQYGRIWQADYHQWLARLTRAISF